MKRKSKLITVLAILLISSGYLVSGHNYSKSELCVVNDIYNPNMAEDLSNASTGTRMAWGTMEAVIGFGLGLINPFVGLGYGL